MGPRLEKGAIHADYLAFGTSSNHIEATNFSDNASSEMKLSLHLELLAQSDLDANGITFCTGALGVRADNDLIAMLRRFAPRIAFFHLRSTQREATLKMQ